MLRYDDAPSLHDIAKRYNVRAISPRAMTVLADELYFAGIVDREQYQAMAFQSELMPNYDMTIGALTGQRAEPDRPRDYTRVWKAKLAFEMKHLTDDPRIAQRTRRILDLLTTMDSALKLPAVLKADESPRRKGARPTPAAFAVPPIRLAARPNERW